LLGLRHVQLLRLHGHNRGYYLSFDNWVLFVRTARGFLRLRGCQWQQLLYAHGHWPLPDVFLASKLYIIWIFIIWIFMQRVLFGEQCNPCSLAGSLPRSFWTLSCAVSRCG
jgi:hypothetical protein